MQAHPRSDGRSTGFPSGHEGCLGAGAMTTRSLIPLICLALPSPRAAKSPRAPGRRLTPPRRMCRLLSMPERGPDPARPRIFRQPAARPRPTARRPPPRRSKRRRATPARPRWAWGSSAAPVPKRRSGIPAGVRRCKSKRHRGCAPTGRNRAARSSPTPPRVAYARRSPSRAWPRWRPALTSWSTTPGPRPSTCRSASPPATARPAAPAPAPSVDGWASSTSSCRCRAGGWCARRSRAQARGRRPTSASTAYGFARTRPVRPDRLPSMSRVLSMASPIRCLEGRAVRSARLLQAGLQP